MIPSKLIVIITLTFVCYYPLHMQTIYLFSHLVGIMETVKGTWTEKGDVKGITHFSCARDIYFSSYHVSLEDTAYF